MSRSDSLPHSIHPLLSQQPASNLQPTTRGETKQAKSAFSVCRGARLSALEWKNGLVFTFWILKFPGLTGMHHLWSAILDVLLQELKDPEHIAKALLQKVSLWNIETFERNAHG